MSDAWWDAEYNKSYDLKKEIQELSKQKGIVCPEFKSYIRSWDLKEILESIKEK